MADVERFVDTASSGGDGTTRNHSGGTAAYASLAAWDSAEQTDLVTATDTHRVRCAGSTADATTTVSGWTFDASFFVTIQGDDVGSDGFNNTNKVWSASHYRIESSTAFRSLRMDENFLVVDGIQVQNTKNSTSASCIDADRANLTIKHCRITSAGVTKSAGIFGNTASGAVSHDIISNIVFDIGGPGIRLGSNGNEARTFNAYNNTVFDCTTGIELATDDADLTYNVKNNAFFNNTTDLTASQTSSTYNHDWNAGEDAPPTDETNGVTIGTLTDAMTTPGGTMKDRIVQVKNDSSTLFNASEITNADDSQVPTVDIVGNTRNSGVGEDTSIGAWANIDEAAVAAVTIGLIMAPYIPT